MAGYKQCLAPENILDSIDIRDEWIDSRKLKKLLMTD